MISLDIPTYDLDFSSGKVFGPEIPRDIVDKKFAMWDYVVDNGLLDSDDEMTKAKAWMLLEDDTIYSYAFLRWEGNPIKMRYYQDAVMSDPHKRIDVEAANQQGKTFSLCTKACCRLLKDHGKNYTIGLVNKSLPQNSQNMRVIKRILGGSEIDVSFDSDSMSVITYKTETGFTNTLVCAVASTSSLGYPFDLILLDEFEFWENPEGLEYMYDQVFEPRTFETKGQIIIYSNPNGKNFVSENLHKREFKSKERVFHVYNVNFLDNPANSREEFELKRSYTHPIIFASTMAAERTDSEGSALTERDIQSTIDADVTRLGFHGCVGKETAWFLDLGFVYDQSVLVGGYVTHNEKNEPQYNFALKCYPQAYPQIAIWGKVEGTEPTVPGLVKKYGGDVALFELDLTGKEGNEIHANESGLSCSGVKMSGPWKAKWYDRFITLCKQGRIKVEVIDNWIDTSNKNFEFQARSLQITTKKSNGNTLPYPLYHHRTEKDHDDIIDAVVGCLSLLDDEMGGAPGASYIPGQKEQSDAEKAEAKNKKIDDTPYDDEIELAVQNNLNSDVDMWRGMV